MKSNAANIHELCQQLDHYRPDQIIQEMQKYKWYNRAVARAVRRKINANSEAYTEEFVNNNLYGICIPLVFEFGFGQVRLNRFLRAYSRSILKIKAEYQEEIDGTPGYCEELLKRKGINTQELVDCVRCVSNIGG